MMSVYFVEKKMNSWAMQNSKVWVIAYFMKKVLNLCHFSSFPFFRFRFQLATRVGGSFMI